MFEDLMTMGSGAILLIVTSLGFWAALPNSSGRPQWFIGTSLERLIPAAITIGLVVGIGLIVKGAASFGVLE